MSEGPRGEGGAVAKLLLFIPVQLLNSLQSSLKLSHESHHTSSMRPTGRALFISQVCLDAEKMTFALWG